MAPCKTVYFPSLDEHGKLSPVPGNASSPLDPQHAHILPDSRMSTPLSTLPLIAHVTLVSGQTGLRTPPLSDAGLITAILWLLEEWARCE